MRLENEWAEFGILNWNNYILYRVETVLAIYSTLRFYLVWRCVRDAFLQALPKRHTVAAFSHINLGSAFAFKVILNGPWATVFVGVVWGFNILLIRPNSLEQSGVQSGVVWGFNIILMSYWWRAAEVSMCLQEPHMHQDPECDERHAKIWNLGVDGEEFTKTNDT
ncbi:hypothetical protein T484DRAFT_1763363 [Baffinella frigidus]|nr:hypothetical protein T484DRAFT_1763363 [Cryptophyta sp. CCMP2293]